MLSKDLIFRKKEERSLCEHSSGHRATSRALRKPVFMRVCRHWLFFVNQNLIIGREESPNLSGLEDFFLIKVLIT